MLFSSIKEINRLLSKGIYVLLFDVFNRCYLVQLKINRLISKGMSNIYYWEKRKFSKLWFSWKENLNKCTSFEDQKGTRYIWGNVKFGILSSAVFRLQNHVSDFF